MFKKQRDRSPYCHNCGKVLQPIDNFCPNCGQENDNKRQSFGRVMSDLVQGFLSIDSRLAKSLPALLFRPGFLTKEYLNNRRQRYLDPVRMFITIIVIYFILAAFENAAPQADRKVITGNGVNLDNVADTNVVFDEGPFKIIADGREGTVAADSISQADELELDIPEYDRIRKMVRAGTTNTEQILDSLQVENTFWNRFYYGEVIKFAGVDFNQFKDYLYSKLPWIIFMLVPVFALLLKLIYIRKKLLYIDHLIFSFHLHSFIFLTGIIQLLFELISDVDVTGWIFLIALVYLVLAFKNFYRQSWLKTILKIILLWALYLITTLFCFLIAMVVVFIIY